MRLLTENNTKYDYRRDSIPVQRSFLSSFFALHVDGDRRSEATATVGVSVIASGQNSRFFLRKAVATSSLSVLVISFRLKSEPGDAKEK